MDPLQARERSVTPVGWVETLDDLGGGTVAPWNENPSWSRWDTPGRTLYVGETIRSAYAEVLQHFRRPRAGDPVAQLAELLGMTPEEYLAAVDQEQAPLGCMPRGQFPAGWRHDRALYRVRLPRGGWWIDVEHGDSLTALDSAPGLSQVGFTEPLTRAHVLGDERRITVALAEHMRSLRLFDGSEALGVTWNSKLGYGKNWAFWMRRLDDGLEPAADDPALVGHGAEIDAHDPDLTYVADRFGIHLH
ncbi:RES domain-containing protein [Actinotalea ferrariae]|uniref:RES domain-containing protein n=1 Tax=Actinotalea ferrariae TaxID=1386098 RepID=UPI001C8C8E2A|nr:RES domain-containing protein [Actinotalea ferrariae]MBX9244662.1 RES domain-containing protein [Actinotalea ferrariae]